MADIERDSVQSDGVVVTTANSKSLLSRLKKDKANKPKKTWQQEVREWIVTLVVALVIAFVVRSFLFEPVVVDGDSMYPTLRHGEIMYVSKTAYGSGFFGIPFTNTGIFFPVGGSPERFDVVVCHYDGKDGGKEYNVVKRVVGLPGDTVELRNGHLYVTDENGVNVGGYNVWGVALPVDEDFIYHQVDTDDSFGPVTVARKGDVVDKYGYAVADKGVKEDGTPLTAEELAAEGLSICEEDQFFLMGDNRTNSTDSRQKGTVSRHEILGRVDAVLWHTIPNRLDDGFGLKPR